MELSLADILWRLVGVMALVFANGFFVAAEFSIVTVRKTRVDQLIAEGHWAARAVRRAVTDPDSFIAATQLGITMASIGLGWIGEPALASLVQPAFAFLPTPMAETTAHTVAVAIAFAVITALHIVLGELAPKSIAIRKAEPTALMIALPLYVFYKITYPAIWLLNHTANSLLRVIGIAPAGEGELAHDEEELRLLLASSPGSSVSKQKRDWLDNIFELSHRVARQIMVPRQDVVYLSTQRSMAENLRIARRSGHTRFPLCDGDLDHAIGLIHIKDLFRKERPISSLREVAREIALVPESLELDRLLKRMRSTSSRATFVGLS